MAFHYEQNPQTDQAELVIDGWENGLAASPYPADVEINLNAASATHGMTVMKNLNIRYLPGSVYSNYKRILNSPSSGIGIPKYWTNDPIGGGYYIVDNGGLVWQSSDPSSVAWTQLTGNSGFLGQGQGIAVYKGYLFVFESTQIDYYSLTAHAWVGAWQTGLQATQHYALWGQDDILYFCNGQFIGSVATVPTTTFNPGDGTTYTFNLTALTLPSYEQNSVWLSELQTDLLIAAGKSIYPWDRTSTNFNGIPVPMKETIYRMINILNKVYVCAGSKGNIYITNGYSTSVFVKIPNSFFGQIDPNITWGDMMAHRNKLYVGAASTNPPGISGIFSIDPDTQIINFENQNSFGLNATSSGDVASCLMGFDNAAIDSYASAWYYNTGGTGGMDYNTTTLYTGGETQIETDLIPVGTFFTPKTFINAEFKLDEPMQSSDSIKLDVRGSLTDSYTTLGTATGSSVISAPFTPFTLQKIQWAQFRITLTSGGATNFIRLHELRIR